jgi:hypothetical protein
MTKQLNLFPELVIKKLVSNLDEEAQRYAYSTDSTGSTNEDMMEAYKAGASKVLGDILDLLKKYTDLHEN